MRARRSGPRRGRLHTAVRDLDLTVARGEFVAVVGPTGCGKSTTLTLVSGLEEPTEGEVLVAGEPVRGIGDKVGFVFQQDAVFPWRTVLANVMAGPRFRGVPKAEAQERARDWLARVGLAAFEDRYPHQLSGGQRKRVALAATFVNDPEILLMDEPFSALDVQTRALMPDELLELWAGTGASVVFVTHDLEESIALADRVVVMTAGPGHRQGGLRRSTCRGRARSRRSGWSRGSSRSTARSGTPSAKRSASPARGAPPMSPDVRARAHGRAGHADAPAPGRTARAARARAVRRPHGSLVHGCPRAAPGRPCSACGSGSPAPRSSTRSTTRCPRRSGTRSGTWVDATAPRRARLGEQIWYTL